MQVCIHIYIYIYIYTCVYSSIDDYMYTYVSIVYMCYILYMYSDRPCTAHT